MTGQIKLLKAFDDEEIISDFDVKTISLEYSNMYNTHMVILETRCRRRFIHYVKPTGEKLFDSPYMIPNLTVESRRALVYQLMKDGYNQTEIAKMIGITQSGISHDYKAYCRNGMMTKVADYKKIEKTMTELDNSPVILKTKDVLNRRTYQKDFDNKAHAFIDDFVFLGMSMKDAREKHDLTKAMVQTIMRTEPIFYIIKEVCDILKTWNGISIIHEVLGTSISYDTISYLMKREALPRNVNKIKIKEIMRNRILEHGFDYSSKRPLSKIDFSDIDIKLSLIVLYRSELISEFNHAQHHNIQGFINNRSKDLYKKGIMIHL